VPLRMGFTAEHLPISPVRHIQEFITCHRAF
jgi:hypothetical protein